MTHELKAIIKAFEEAKKNHSKCVLATLVDVEGSSYRRPGVRMLVTEDGAMTGAISGGCIEKDVVLESASVFKTGHAKMMSYDGRYRLGCDGVIYILLEAFEPSAEGLEHFRKSLTDRLSITITSYFSRNLEINKGIGSLIEIKGKRFNLNEPNLLYNTCHDEIKIFSQELRPMFQLLIFGAEHDAVKLCKQAGLLGWEVTLVTSPIDGYTEENFPGSSKVLQVSADSLPANLIDKNTAIVMMTHNYAKDLNYLIHILDKKPVYLGLLGPSKRRNKLLEDAMEHTGLLPEELMKVLHGPAGLDLGSETAEEIALSICAEILAFVQEKDAKPLKTIEGDIHCAIKAV